MSDYYSSSASCLSCSLLYSRTRPSGIKLMARPFLDHDRIITAPDRTESPLPSRPSPDSDSDPVTLSVSVAAAVSVLPTDLPAPDHCVICLDVISEKAVALPCNHDQFDFPCLGTWLQRHQVCPLCKGDVTGIRFQVTDGGGGDDDDDTKIFHLPPVEVPPEGRRASHSSSSNIIGPQYGAIRHRQRPGLEAAYWRRDRERSRSGIYRRRGRGMFPPHAERVIQDTALDLRRRVYRDRLYALHVGSNRISRYRTLTPSMFQTDSHLVSRARMFLRRELQVFEFLYPQPISTQSSSTSSSSSSSSSSSTRSPSTSNRRANNADFVLEYVVSILQSIDLKGSSGQAEELLTDFLGRDNARLFIHELVSWLRSPFEKLEHWDRNVQYATSTSTSTSTGRSEVKEQDHQTRDLNLDRRAKCQQGQEDPSLSTRSLSSPSSVSCTVSTGDSNPARVPQWFSDRFVLGNGGGRRAVADPP